MKKRIYLEFKGNKANLEPYSGKWVAFIDNQPVAWDKSLNLLMQKVKKQRLPKEPSIMLVPHKDEGPYILTII